MMITTNNGCVCVDKQFSPDQTLTYNSAADVSERVNDSYILIIHVYPLYYRPRTYVRREVMFSQVCVCSGGVPGLGLGGGSPQSQILGGGQQGTQSQIFGGYPVSDFQGGYPVSDFLGGGYSVSDFLGGYPVSVKGKIFDTRFGLIHVQTGKKFFCQGTLPPSKGKNF